MVYSIVVALGLLLQVHQISGGFFRFNDPEHMTAPMDIEDVDQGSYDELLKYNPSIALKDIRFGGDPKKPFDWSAPEIETQQVQLVTPNEFMYEDETEGFPEENRDELFELINRAATDNLSKEINEANITAEKNNEIVKKIAEKNRNETDIDEIREKREESLKFYLNWPLWLGDRNPAYVQKNETDEQEKNGWKIWTQNETRNNETVSRSQTRIIDLNILRERLNISNKKALRKEVRPQSRTYKIEVPLQERTMNDRHIEDWDKKEDTHDYELSGTYIASCFRCGELKYGKWWRPSVEKRERERRVIPTDILCYEAFEGDDWTFKTKARHLRSKCYNNEEQPWKYEIGDDNYNYYHECVSPKVDTWLINRTGDLGNPVECFGRYTGKCFKRFLDVGKVYTERGCASWPPHESNTFASHRFTKMEYLLYKKDNGCVSSPMVSLTPFDRGISLYVHYHVCVCTGKWCNAATQCSARLLLLFTLCFLTSVGMSDVTTLF